MILEFSGAYSVTAGPGQRPGGWPGPTTLTGSLDGRVAGGGGARAPAARASYRATRDFPAAVRSLELTFSAAAMTGPAELLDPSAAVFEAIGNCCASFTTQRVGREAFKAGLQEAYEALGAYTAVLRDRLSVGASAAEG